MPAQKNKTAAHGIKGQGREAALIFLDIHKQKTALERLRRDGAGEDAKDRS